MAQRFLSFFINATDQQITYRVEIDYCGHEIVIRNAQVVAFVIVVEVVAFVGHEIVIRNAQVVAFVA